jgi:Leucine-rich repeat (LRR) protein
VNIPDPNLRAAIEAELGKAAGDTITVADMESLTTLEADRADISDLTGLEAAINLTELRLDANNISDISALSGLANLTRLRLSHNPISDQPERPVS